jgi:hypothetical protein
VSLLVLWLCKGMNEEPCNQGRRRSGRQVDRSLRECEWRPPSISVPRVDGAIEMGKRTRGRILYQSILTKQESYLLFSGQGGGS